MLQYTVFRRMLCRDSRNMGKIAVGTMGGTLPYGKWVTGESKNSQNPRESSEVSLLIIQGYEFPFS